jgi:hypothetical protein
MDGGILFLFVAGLLTTGGSIILTFSSSLGASIVGVITIAIGNSRKH